THTLLLGHRQELNDIGFPGGAGCLYETLHEAGELDVVRADLADDVRQLAVRPGFLQIDAGPVHAKTGIELAQWMRTSAAIESRVRYPGHDGRHVRERQTDDPVHLDLLLALVDRILDRIAGSILVDDIGCKSGVAEMPPRSHVARIDKQLE